MFHFHGHTRNAGFERTAPRKNPGSAFPDDCLQPGAARTRHLLHQPFQALGTKPYLFCKTPFNQGAGCYS